MADTGTMKLLVNTPERVFFNGEATFVELATSEGVWKSSRRKGNEDYYSI